MQKKYFFFDIDGTLTHHEKFGYIPKETVEIVQRLKEAGHFVSIATGRSFTMAEEYSVMTGIPNVVCYGGNDVYVNGECIYHEPFDREFALSVIHECLEKDIPFGIATDHSFNFHTHSKTFVELNENRMKLGETIFEENLDYIENNEIVRMFLGVTQEEEQKLDSIRGVKGQRHKNAPLLLIEPDDKSKGIKKMIELIAGNYEDVVVFGDGNNDIRMFQEAPFAVAMGNATEILKKEADFITKNSGDEGIRYAVEKFGWL